MNKKLMLNGVFFSYAALVAQILYSFLSIPLGLSYLTKEEFGLWSLVGSLVAFMGLLELGITNAFMRHFMDCKAKGDSHLYGRLFVAANLSLLGISVLILACGFVVAFTSASLFSVPEELYQEFRILIIGQSAMTALGIAMGMAGAPLYVNHRQDLKQIGQIGLFLVWFVALYLAYRAGFGIYAGLVHQAAGILWIIPYGVINCYRNGYYPVRGTLALPARNEWFSVLRYSRDMSVVQIASLLIVSLPQLLLPRIMGLEAAATWAVCTRPFAILRQIAIKPFDVALPMLCEQALKGHMKSVVKRWKEVSQIVLAASGCFFSVAATNNTRFIELWTDGKISWDITNDWMISLYFYVYGIANVAFGMISVSKNLGFMRFVPLFQVAFSFALAIPLTIFWGIAGLLLGMTVPFMFCMITFGIRDVGKITGQAIRPLVMEGILRPSLALPVAIAAAWACSHLACLLPGYFGLALSSGTGFLAAAVFTALIAMSRDVRAEITDMAMRPLRRFFAKPT